MYSVNVLKMHAVLFFLQRGGLQQGLSAETVVLLMTDKMGLVCSIFGWC